MKKRDSKISRVYMGLAILFLLLGLTAVWYAGSTSQRLSSTYPLDAGVYATGEAIP